MQSILAFSTVIASPSHVTAIGVLSRLNREDRSEIINHGHMMFHLTPKGELRSHAYHSRTIFLLSDCGAWLLNFWLQLWSLNYDYLLVHLQLSHNSFLLDTAFGSKQVMQNSLIVCNEHGIPS